MNDLTDNYVHPLGARTDKAAIYFCSADGLPDAVRANPAGWVVWDLRPFNWQLALHRVGEDPDAYVARLRGLYGPCPPGCGVPPSISTPYRRGSSKAPR